MKPYADLRGKNRYYAFGKIRKPKKIRQSLKQSARGVSNKLIAEGINLYNERYDEVEEYEIGEIWGELTGWDDW